MDADAGLTTRKYISLTALLGSIGAGFNSTLNHFFPHIPFGWEISVYGLIAVMSLIGFRWDRILPTIGDGKMGRKLRDAWETLLFASALTVFLFGLVGTAWSLHRFWLFLNSLTTG